MGVGNRTTIELECPFCKKGKIPTFFVDSYNAGVVSRISAGRKEKTFKVPAEYKILGGCTECGKSKKDVQAMYDGTYKPDRTKEEWAEYLKKKGLPLIIGSVKKEEPKQEDKAQ